MPFPRWPQVKELFSAWPWKRKARLWKELFHWLLRCSNSGFLPPRRNNWFRCRHCLYADKEDLRRGRTSNRCPQAYRGVLSVLFPCPSASKYLSLNKRCFHNRRLTNKRNADWAPRREFRSHRVCSLSLLRRNKRSARESSWWEYPLWTRSCLSRLKVRYRAALRFPTKVFRTSVCRFR